MWYLIIPPVIVIASLVFLIWFLTNRAELPSIQERMNDIANHSSFREWQTLRLKQLLFRSLEKGMRSLKVLSLRVHNSFHTIGQSLREKRHQSDLLVTSLLNLKKEKAESSGEEYAVPASSVLRSAHAPLTIQEDTRVSLSVSSFALPVAEARPMVSERAVIPETKPNKMTAHDIKEEERLIKKIAANPKNVSAYEALGDYYLEHGDVTDAKSCYRQVLKLSPIHRMVKVKIRKLERLMETEK